MGLFNFFSKKEKNLFSNEVEGLLAVVFVCSIINRKITLGEVNKLLLHPIFGNYDHKYMNTVIMDKYLECKADELVFLVFACEVISPKKRIIILKLVYDHLLCPNDDDDTSELNLHILATIAGAFGMTVEELSRILMTENIDKMF